MLKKVAIYGFVLGLTIMSGMALSGNFEDLFTKTYILPNIKNYATSSLPATGVKGRMAYDSTIGTLVQDNGTVWGNVVTDTTRLGTRSNSNALNRPTATGGTLATGSTDTAGSITSITTGDVVLTFSAAMSNAPFCVATPGQVSAGTSARASAPTTASVQFQTVGAGAVNYLCVNRL